MAAIVIGATYQTSKTGISGTIAEVVLHPSGVTRIRLDVDGASRWTSVRLEAETA